MKAASLTCTPPCCKHVRRTSGMSMPTTPWCTVPASSTGQCCRAATALAPAPAAAQASGQGSNASTTLPCVQVAQLACPTSRVGSLQGDHQQLHQVFEFTKLLFGPALPCRVQGCSSGGTSWCQLGGKRMAQSRRTTTLPCPFKALALPQCAVRIWHARQHPFLACQVSCNGMC